MCKRRIFAVDLDNTLIYSEQRSRCLSERVCVEQRGAEELSYMSLECRERLSRLNSRLTVVPVTTRSLEQYGRIRLFPDREPELALVSNGGILLERGRVHEGWLAQTRKLTAASWEQLALADSWLERDPGRCFELRRVDGLFVYTKTRQPEETAGRLRELLDASLVSVVENLSKIYVLPRCLTKGLGIRRLREFLGTDRTDGLPEVLAAGDSNFDISMLEEADRGISTGDPVMREGLKGAGHIRFWSPPEGRNRMTYTDFVLDMAEAFSDSGQDSSFFR